MQTFTWELKKITATEIFYFVNNSHDTNGGGIYGGVYSFDGATTKTTVQLLFFKHKGGDEHTILKIKDFKDLVSESCNSIIAAFPDARKFVLINPAQIIKLDLSRRRQKSRI